MMRYIQTGNFIGGLCVKAMNEVNGNGEWEMENDSTYMHIEMLDLLRVLKSERTN